MSVVGDENMDICAPTRTWVPSPIGHGWIMQNDSVAPTYFEGPTALEKLKNYYCTCLGAKCTDEDKCSCVANGVACSEVCRCEASEQCKNPIKSDDDSDDLDEATEQMTDIGQ